MSAPGGWDAFLWQRDNRKSVLLSAREPRPALAPALRFLADLGEGWPVLFETDGNTGRLTVELLQAGFIPDCDLPGHFIPTDPAWRTRLQCNTGSVIRWVRDQRTLADFAYVQDQAYRATYDWPKGCASLFYTDPASLIGPDSMGAVLYEDGLPVRTAAIIHKRGIVAGVAGAAVPSVRGQHKGELLMNVLLDFARQWWGAEVVHHITMPCARPIAERLGLEQVTLYHRWRRA